MKYKFLSLILASTIISAGTLSATNTSAQENIPSDALKFEHQFTKEDFQKKMAEKIAKQLDLTAEQQAQAAEIREKGKKEIEPLIKEMKALREKIDAKRRANMEEFEDILTSDQKTKFDEMKKNAPQHHGLDDMIGPRHARQGAKNFGKRQGPKMGPRGMRPDQEDLESIEVFDEEITITE